MTMTDEQRCQLCGQRVRVAGGHEGTQYYVGVAEAELAEVRALARELARDLSSLAQFTAKNEHGKKRVFCTNCGNMRGSHEPGCILARPAVRALLLAKGESDAE